MSRQRLVVLLLVLGTLAVYLPVSKYGFLLYDDNDYVTENPIVQNGLTWNGVKWAFTTWDAANWHPLTWLSHMTDCQLFNLAPGMHHDVNVLFHIANAALLLVLLVRLTGTLWVSAFVAALFAWHPMHVESVAWISERKDVLSTFFELLALLCYARYVTDPHLTPTLSPPIRMGAEREQQKDARNRAKALEPTTVRRSYLSLFYWLALFFFALGLMSKPMLVTMPLVMLLLDFWPLGRFKVQGSGFSVERCGKLLLEKVPFFVLAGASCVVTFLAQHHGGAVIPLEKVPMAARLENVPIAYAMYLQKLFWPAHLAVFYPLSVAYSPGAVIAALILLAGITAASWLAWKKHPYLLIGWLWFLVTLVPVIGLVQVGGAAMADRYSYFPSIGIFLAVTLGVREMAGKFHLPKPIITVGAIAILGACLALTHRQLSYWSSNLSLFSHALAVTADNDTVRLNLGFAYDTAGDKTTAMTEYRRALELNPENVQAHNNLATLLDAGGQKMEALSEYQTALRLQPDSVGTHDNLGTLYMELGQFDDAEKQYTEAAQLEPMDWHAPYLMGKALLKQSDDAGAIPYLQRAVANAPDNSHVLNFVGQVLASDADDKVRNGASALELASKANDLSGGIQPDVLDTLAMAYAENGQFSQAQQTAEGAIKLFTALNLTNKVEEISRRLQLYQNNEPFRQSFTNMAVN
jgi:tetratricopeptide (TPR) repeat protein